jgi:LytS/YehU family sensor histidine kinase
MTRSDRLAACATLPRNGLYVVVFNSAIAVLLSATGYGGSIGVSLVYSQCIGLAAWLLIDGSRRLLWPNKRPPLAWFMLLIVAAMPLASLGGSRLAALLLGHRWSPQTHPTLLLITAAAAFVATLYFWEREKLADLEAATARERSRSESVERQAAEARLKLLQAQIEPHFLFNTLANLRALIAADPPRALAMLDHLNDFLRATLAAARKDRSTLGDEFALLRVYLEIVRIRMGARLEFDLDLPAELADTALPPMLVQPLVENAIKHGLEPKVDGGEVAVRARAADGRLQLSVSDNGLGLGAAASDGARTGIDQVRKRLRSVYGESARLELAERAGGGVTAALVVPLEKHDK